ncbi:MAG: GDSL-type esterase/lipase family protein [Candidatus Omnitrophica bacterium]|nr:GDSL-type esterase/lipase family protein [Candidatus Omnitrophota bacterium]
MRKINLISYLIIIVIISLIGCAKKEIKNIDSKGKNIICFGNSLTVGYGAQPGQDYPSLLAKLISFPVINAGIDGDTSIEGLRRIKTDVLDRDPLLVIIEFGGNDFLRKISYEETAKNIEEMVKLIHAHGAMVAIVDISATFILDKYHQMFLDIAKRNQAIFIPGILKGIIANPDLKSDFIHPNAQGYSLIAQRIYRAILPYLNKNTLLRESKR